MLKDTLIVLPTFNEEKCIREITRHLLKKQVDFIIVDGFSTDNTIKIASAEGAEIHFRNEPGKSSAIIYALKYAYNNGYKYMAYCDADLSYSLDELLQLIDRCSGYDVVIGMRDYRNMNIQRRLGNSIANFLFEISFGVKNIDVATGMRVLMVNAFDNKIYSKEFNVETEIWIIAFLQSLKIERYNIAYKPSGGKSNFNLKHYIRGLLYILKMGGVMRLDKLYIKLGIKN